MIDRKFTREIDISALYLQAMRRKNFFKIKNNIVLEQFEKLHNENLKYLNFDHKNALSISIIPEPNSLFLSSKIKKNGSSTINPKANLAAENVYGPI